MRENPTLGALFLLLAWLFGAAMSALVKVAFPMTNIWTILFAQSAVALICTLPWTLSHLSIISAFRSWKLIATRTVSGFIAFFFLFLAVSKTKLVNAVLMNNTAPIFVPFIAYLWLRIRIHPNLWWGIILGFVGITLILKPDASLLREIGVLYGLISGILLAVIQVSLRELASREKPVAILFYYFLFLTCVNAVGSAIDWPSPEPIAYLYLAGIGVAMFFFQLFSIIAFSYARPVKIATMNYSAIVYSAVIGWLFWRETIDWISWIGIICVVAGGALTIYLDKCNEK